MHQRGFHVIDYVVFGITIAVSLGIGLYFAFTGKRQDSNNEYLMGDRKMKLIPVAISILVSFVSTIGIMGHPAEVYAYGTQFMLYMVAISIGLLFGTFVFVPLFYPLRLTSVFEYHEMRFHKKYVEAMAIFLAVLTVLLLNGIMIFSPCIALQSVSGFPAWASMIISGVAGVAYTTLGGMKAVVWTDVFQALIILIGLVAIVIKGTIEVGGVKEVWKINDEWGRIKFFDFSLDPTERITFWSVVVFNSLLWMCMVTAQPSVQRFMALPSLKKAKMSTLFIIPGFIVSGMLTCVSGVTAFAYYAKIGCDPLWAGKIKSPNEIIAYFVMDVLNVPSLPGIFVACLFSASLSSVSSSYNAMAAIAWQNIFRKRYGHLPPQKQANITKLSTLVFGLFSIGVAFLLMKLGGTLVRVTYSCVGGLGGPLMGVTLVAGLFPKVGPRGVMVGTVLSVCFCMWLSLGATFSSDYDLPLPGPTHNCTFPESMVSANYSGIGQNLTDDDGLSAINISTTASALIQNGGMVPVKKAKTGLQWLYSISYFYYPGIGIIIVMIVSILFMLIPGLEIPQDTPDRLIFSCVRRCCGKNEAESLDEKPDEKVPLNQNGDNKLPLNGKEEEVWALRDDVKLSLGNSEKSEKQQCQNSSV